MNEFSEFVARLFAERENREPKRNWSAVDVYGYIQGVRDANIHNDLALDTCIIAECMFNRNNNY